MSKWDPPVLTEIEYAMQRLQDDEYDVMRDEDGYLTGSNEKEHDLFIIQENIKRLSTYESLEKRSKELTGMQLNELGEQYQLLQQAFYVACWKLADYDDKSCYDGLEASDAWKDICMKKAEKKVEILNK